MPLPSRVASSCREEPLVLQGRNTRLPDLYEVFDHPKHPSNNPGRSIVIKYDTRPIAMKDQKQFEESLEVPLGQREELKAQGLFELRPGDYVFCRPGLENTDPRDDITIGWVVGPIAKSAKHALDEATDSALGPKETRTATEVPLERGAERVGEGRCYNIAISVELPTGCIAPQAAMKPSGNCEQFHKLCRVLSTAIAKISMEDMDLAPVDLQDLIRTRTEMLGLPRVGTHGNYAFQTIQCNIAAAGGLASLAAQLASFGEAHFDDKDCPGHTTNMQVASQLPEGWDPGYFHLVGLGVFVALDKHTSFNFQGNRRHGASGPFPPPGTDLSSIPAWAYRFTLISYPPSRMCNQKCRYRVAATPSSEPIFLAPEMQNPEYDPSKVTSTTVGSANFFRDGHHFMDNKSHVEFAIQSLYRQTHYLLKQLPAHLGVQRLSTSNFFNDITYLNEEGERVAVEAWEWAPPLGGEEEERFLERWRAGTAEWDAHVQKATSMIPAKSYRSATARAESAVGGPSSTSRAEGTPRDTARQSTASGSIVRVNAEASTSTNPGPSRKRCWVEIQTPRFLLDKRRLEAEAIRQGERAPKRLRTTGSYTANHGGKGSLGKAAMGEDEWISSASSDDDLETAKGGKGKGGTKGKGKGVVKRQRTKASKGKGKESKNTQSEVLASQGFVFRLMNFSDASHVHAELNKLLAGAQTIPTDMAVDVEEYDDRYEGTTSMIESDPLSLNTVRAVFDMKQGSDAIYAMVQQSEYANRQHHKRYALAKLRTWKWLRSIREAACVLIKKGKASLRNEKSWLGRLVLQLIYAHESSERYPTISSGAVGFHVPPEMPVDFIYDNRMAWRAFGHVLQNMDEPVADAVVEAVRTWMRWDLLKDVKLGWFVEIVEEQLGDAALTMDYVWSIVASFRSSDVSLGAPPARSGYKYERDTKLFRETLTDHPIMDTTSHEGHLYRQYRDFLNGDLSPEELHIEELDGSWNQYADMWRKALEYTRDPDQVTDDKFIQLLQGDADFYLPIREKAPSRVRSRSELGPYRAEVITTPAGIFSAVVWRAITYRSEFSKNHSMTFESSEALAALVRSITEANPTAAAKQNSKGNTYFCDRKAYGQPTRRSMDLHPLYWDSIQQKVWSKFVHANPKPTFSAAIKYFQEDKAIPSKVFPQLGDLGRLTLTGDLVYAGVVQEPTVVEMAQAIVELDAGAIAGLRALKFLTRTWPATRGAKVEAVVEALGAIQEKMTDTFTEQEMEEAGFDLLSLEHSLCKFSRALRLNVLSKDI
ncbi:hypothetical protein DFP72DRAFT_1072189 [Ephemerocybe angulata]|uniref:Uncharacterized protein n=1 Tax=Ephemerocybe angulata TaxID=980116 RepID=A0A8H6HRH6_9AGAR|nr:hypothetical protein DFP72DRAFT_1072189 [Tulosesus angulatus]